MYEIKLKMVKEVVPGTSDGPTKINQPIDVYTVINPILRDLPHEVTYALYLTVDNELIGIHMVSKGTIDECRSAARDVFSAALVCSAYKVILVHNHPSGSLEVSESDERLTEYMINASKVIGVYFVDHVVVGAFDAGYVSIRQSNKVNFDI
jgi:DNA repair protein RadC